MIEIDIVDGNAAFEPGDFLMCEYRLRGIEGLEVTSLEASVVWLTQGKGSEDIGVHFFQRFTRDALSKPTLGSLKRLSTVLPNSPLSYDGRIVKVRWAVRVRLFYEEKELSKDQEFQLGHATIPTMQTNAETIARPNDQDASN